MSVCKVSTTNLSTYAVFWNHSNMLCRDGRWLDRKAVKFASATGYRHLISALTLHAVPVCLNQVQFASPLSFSILINNYIFSKLKQKTTNHKAKQFILRFFFSLKPIVVIDTFYLLSWFSCTVQVLSLGDFVAHFISFSFSFNSLFFTENAKNRWISTNYQWVLCVWVSAVFNNDENWLGEI